MIYMLMRIGGRIKWRKRGPRLLIQKPTWKEGSGDTWSAKKERIYIYIYIYKRGARAKRQSDMEIKIWIWAKVLNLQALGQRVFVLYKYKHTE